MDKNNRSLNSNKNSPALVPFQGIGTRLRRSRSKDHSSEKDNLAIAGGEFEIANLKRLNHHHNQSHQSSHYNGFNESMNNFYSAGTLERPKRFFTANNHHQNQINTQFYHYPSSTSNHSSFVGHNAVAGGGSVGMELTRNNGRNNGSASSLALYEESRLLSHQYEEPQYLIDNNYRTLTNNNRLDSFQNKRTNELLDYGSLLNNNNNGNNSINQTTTIIPPSKLFAKTLSTYKQSYEQASSYETYGSKNISNGRMLDKNDCTTPSSTIINDNNELNDVENKQSKSNKERNILNDCTVLLSHRRQELDLVQDHSNSDNGNDIGANNNDNVEQRDNMGVNEEENDNEDENDDEPTVSLVGEELLSSSAAIGARMQLRNINSGSPLRPIQQQHHLTGQPTISSQPYNSIMHTYSNPFQNCNMSSATYSEDTTGPMIPSDLNTMRPSQLLKNSFAGSGPPPSLQSNSERNLVSYLTERLLSYLRAERKTAPEINEHRCCSWFRSVSTLTLLILIFILIIIIIFITAMNKDKLSSEQQQKHYPLYTKHSDGTRVPCVVVEDLESSSTSQHLSSQFGRDSADNQQIPENLFPFDSALNGNCPTYFPRDSSQYKEINLVAEHTSPMSTDSSTKMPISLRLMPFSSWSIWFNQLIPMYINFQFYTPISTKLALVVNKNEPPTLTSHRLFQIISEDNLSEHWNNIAGTNGRSSRDSSLTLMQFKHLFDQGSWYLTLVNDMDINVPIMVNITAITNQTIHCPANCHNHGYCHLGKCQCFPGFIGHDCADNVCPVFCGGHGQYLQGSCQCEAGWKGRECTVRLDECEISDCNGNGHCIQGICHCQAGFKGEHCDQVDCIDPKCSGHGACLDGNCFCRPGFVGTNCSLADTKLHKFFPNCSGHGVYDYEHDQCLCHLHYTGPDCSQLSCSLDCGQHGSCKDGRCFCDDGWSGSNCQYRICDPRCLEHGKCHNGTCHCQNGWMGKHCTLNGCTNSCSNHGQCVSYHSAINNELEYNFDGTGLLWKCQCDNGWNGHDCSAPQETNCNDEIDNDNDGLIDCADSECCLHEQCGHQSLMCITSPDPLDILLRKQPLPPTSSFFQKVLFLIEDGSVQSYAQKDVYSPRRASIIRGQVVSKELIGLIGIRVSVVNDQKYGFTLTRSDGWFDILVNGGGIITLQFQRNPFYPIKKSILVPWNDITVIQNPIIMLLGPSALNDNGNEFQNFLLNINNNNNDQPSSNFHHFFSISDFGDSNWLKWATLRINSEFTNSNDYSLNSCDVHDFEQIKPTILDHTFQSSSLFLTPNSESICDNLDSCIIAETQTVQERIPIGNTKLNLVHQSSQAHGYSSTLVIQLTPSVISKSLHFILLRILIEGNVHEKIFEADPDLQYTFQWNKRNVYRQKVYGFSTAKVYVGYYYQNCPRILWTAFSAKIRGYDMEISDIGQWNLEIHNRFNPHEGIFQRGDGQFINFKNNDHLPLIIEPLAGIDGQARSFACANLDECNTNLISARFLMIVALASAPDGSIFVGDSNLIRLITPEGIIYTVYKFRNNRTNRQNFEYHIAFNSMDQYLYISDPDRFQIVRIPMQDKFENTQEIPMVEPEIVVGTGEQCFPNDRFACGDGKTGTEVQLSYPKDLAFGLDGSLFFADGNVIRMLNTAGYVRLMAGQYSKRQWKPISCGQSHDFDNIKFKWPTSLAVNPIDGALYFVDNNVLFKLNQNLKISILYGYPSFCLEDPSLFNPNYNEIDCNGINRWNSQTMAFCGEELLFGSIAFAPNGVLYLTDVGRRNENRIFSLFGNTMKHVAGYKSKKSAQQHKCPVEKCIDMAGNNCTCLISQYESDDNTLDPKISLNIHFQSISAITIVGDGTVYISDEGKLQIYALKSYIPQMDDQQEIKIIIPNVEEMYVFNKYGQHVRTRSITTGRTLYTFIYNQENSFGKLTEVIDSAGHKIMFIRDPKSGSIQMIESTTGLKCQITINKQNLLESFNNGGNRSYYFDYFGNGLIRSRYETFTGRTNIYQYNSNGRIKYLIRPNGDLIAITFQGQNGIILTEMPLFSSKIASNAYQTRQDLQNSIINNNYDNEPFEINKRRQHRRQVYMIIANNSEIKFQNNAFDGQQQFNLYSLIDGTLRLNVAGINIDFYLRPKISKLSLDLLAIQAQLFPFISKFLLIPQQTNQPHAQIKNGYQLLQNQQALDLEIDYNLKLKSSFIDSVEKLITINNTASTLLKIEYDWNANREIYYNQSQRPLLFIQYDDYGRPIQWIPNIKEHWPANSITYDKFGQLDTWQDGQQTFTYQRDRIGRITELRQTSTESTTTKIRYTYSSSSSSIIDGDLGQHELNNINNNNNNINPSFMLPTMVTLKSGHRYTFDLDNAGRIQAIILPKGAQHNLSIVLVLGSHKFSYCTPIATDLINTGDSNIHISPSSHCYLIYFDQNWQPMMSVLPYDTGKIINHYRSTYSMMVNDYTQRLNVDENIIIDRMIHGNGLVERWLDRKTNQVIKGVWRDGNIEFINQYKYQRSTFLLKHQSYQYGKIHSITPLTYNYRYDNLLRLRSIQPKLGAINLANLDFSYDSQGRIETIGNYRYFEHTANETLLGDGISLLVRRYDPIRKLIRHHSLTVSDKKVFRADYLYDSQGLLVQIRMFMHHLGNNKVGLQNFTYDLDGQLIEMQGREHWRFIYDANGNLITFLYMGNRIDIEYDHGDRIIKLGKNQNDLPIVGGSTPYLTDLRGFVVQRGNEYLSYNNLGQLIQAITPNRYEVNYIYDYLGRLVLRRDNQKNVTQFFYGNPKKPYLVTHSYNNADGRMMTMIYDDIDDLLIMIRLNNENFYVVCDQNGSPILVFDHRAQVIKEIHRSPYGHILFDSNPGIYIPVDFHGGIPDPLTNLVYFSQKHEQRFYDTLIGRWLVPKIDRLFNENLLKNPRAIHLYQFMKNDPINIRKYKEVDNDLNGIYSLEQISETLSRHTTELVNQDIMASTPAQMLHYLKQLTPTLEKYDKNCPLKSLYINSIGTLFRNVQQYSNFQAKTYYSKFIENDWTSALNILPMISWKEGLFPGGIVLTCMPNVKDNIIQIHFANHISISTTMTMTIDPLYKESLMVLMNGSYLLDVHLVMAGQNYYYLVRDDNDISMMEKSLTKTTASLMAKFRQYQTRLNMTIEEVHLKSPEKKIIIEVKIYQPAAIFNIRFGSSVEIERERVLRLARRYAINQRFNHERLNIIREIFTNWNDKEKQFIIKSKELPNEFDNSSPFSFEYYHSIEELVEDPNNIVFMRNS